MKKMLFRTSTLKIASFLNDRRKRIKEKETSFSVKLSAPQIK